MSQLSLIGGDPDATVLHQVGLVIHRAMLAQVSYDDIAGDVPWQQYRWSMYGQTGDRPRRECWYHDDSRRGYEFGGGAPVMPVPWTPLVRYVRRRVEELTGQRFNSNFANQYLTGQHKIDWHADDDDWIGPTIVSVSFGGTRTMRFRPKKRAIGARSLAIELHHGDVLVMPPGTQDRWQHCIPRRSGNVRPRVNLTFRQGVSP